MKILFDCTTLHVGGGVQAGLNLIGLAIEEPDVEAHVAASTVLDGQMPPNWRTRLASYAVVDGASLLQKLSVRREMAGLEARLAPDLVYTVFGPAYWQASGPHVQGFARGLQLHPRLARAMRGTLWSQAFGFIKDLNIAWSTARAPYLVVETQTVRARLKDQWGVKPERVFVIENSPNLLFAQEIERLRASEPREIRENGPFSLFVPSAYYPHKNLEILPAVVRLLKDRGVGVEVIFTLDAESPGWRGVAREAEAQGVLESCRAGGYMAMETLARHYHACDLVLLPTLLESSTAVYPETFLAGRLLATSDRDFARELCLDGAAYFDPHDPAAMAEAVAGALTDPDRRAGLLAGGGAALARNYPDRAAKWAKTKTMMARVAAGAPASA